MGDARADREQVAAWSKETTTVQVYSVFDPGYPYDDDGGSSRSGSSWSASSGGRDWYPATGDHMLKIEVGRTGPTPGWPTPAWSCGCGTSASACSTPRPRYMTPDRDDPTPQVAPVPVFVPKGAEGDPTPPRSGSGGPSSCCWPARGTATPTSRRPSRPGPRCAGSSTPRTWQPSTSRAGSPSPTAPGSSASGRSCGR